MSGGVDSSVSAALLKERGFDVIGVHMKCYNVDGCAEQDAEDARRAAEVLSVPFYVFDFEKETPVHDVTGDLISEKFIAIPLPVLELPVS